MYPPVNQVFLGNSSYDPLLTSDAMALEDQIKILEAHKAKLLSLKGTQQLPITTQQNKHHNNLIWDIIEEELNQLTDEQKERIFKEEEYKENNTNIQMMVQSKLVDLVKEQIEDTSEGKDLLEKQLNLTKKLKTKVVEESNKQLELFTKFKEYSKLNPNATYDEFIKTI